MSELDLPPPPEPPKEPTRLAIVFENGDRTSVAAHLVDFIEVDGARFALEYLVALANSHGQIFRAERTGDTVTVHAVVTREEAERIARLGAMPRIERPTLLPIPRGEDA